MPFCVVSVLLPDNDTCLQTCRQSFLCGRHNTCLRCFQALSCTFGGKRNTFETSIVSLRGSGKVYMCRVTLHTPHSTLFSPHSTLYTLHSALYTLHPTLHTLHFTFHILHSTLCNPNRTLHTSHFILNTLHSAVYTAFLFSRNIS